MTKQEKQKYLCDCDNDESYVGEDGIIYCVKCGGRKELNFGANLYLSTWWTRTMGLFY